MCREEAKREYNESIRALVKYVSKRDERVKAHAAKEEARKEAAKERARKDKEERIARHKEELERMEDEMVAQEEERWEAYQKEMRDLGMDGELFEEEVDLDTGQYSSTYCVACRRPFKSEKAYVQRARWWGSNEVSARSPCGAHVRAGSRTTVARRSTWKT